MRSLVLFFLLACVNSFAQNNLPPIGMWREHLPYQSAIAITASQKKIYAATPFSLFSVDLSTNEVERISKVAGLSETGISTIQFDAITGKLFIAYTNSNIDVIDANGIHNIPDLKRENISGNKTIYNIFPDGNRWYLSSGLGVLVFDAGKLEIKESWLIGNNGGYVKTNAFTKNNNRFYAATDEGLKTIETSNQHPEDFHNWQNLSGTNGLTASPCRMAVTLGGKTLALQNDSVFTENGAIWNLFFADDWPVVSMNASEEKLFICQRKTDGASRVLVLNADGNIEQTIQQPEIISYPEKGISVNGTYWIADRYGGLSRWNGNQCETYLLNSPQEVATGEMTVYNHKLYATAGAVNGSWNYQYNRNGIYKLSDGSWTNYNQFHFPVLDSMMDFITVAVDPRDQSVWGGSYGGGLLHITTKGELQIFKQNSPVQQTVGDPGSYRVSGLAFDYQNNLWISNFGANQQLHVLKNDGTWQSFSAPFPLLDNAVSQIIIDDAGQKWIVSPMDNGLIVFNDNNTIDNTTDDHWKIFRTGSGAGNLPSKTVLSIAKDKNGFIWIGTSEGVALIPCAEAVFTDGCEAVWPTIKQDNFANYLFKGQPVQTIAVDGADRKWMGTQTGAWLVSTGGDSILNHFTEQNSPLLSNDVRSIAIDGKTGEVFFATAKGICSFRGTATEVKKNRNEVLVFPNPVPPDYEGTIGIRGLPENSIVRITETNGRMVYQTRSLGGQAVWNGRDFKGSRVASGIYIVMAEDDYKQQKAVGKIVFISR